MADDGERSNRPGSKLGVLMILQKQDYYRLYYGSEQLGLDLLFPLATNEPEDSRKARFEKATYMNIVAKAVDTYMGYVFSNPPKVSDVRFFELVETLRRSVFHSILGGACLLIVLPKDPKIKVFPVYSYQCLPNGDIEIDVESKGVSGKWLVTADRIITPDGEYIRNDDSVVEVYWNEKKASLVRDLAPYAVKIFNYDSIADKQADNAAFWVSSGTPLPANKNRIEPYMHFGRTNNDQPEPKFHMPEVQQMEGLDKRIDKFILRAGKTVGLEREFADEFYVASGVSQQMQMVSTNAITMLIASANVRAVNRVSEGGGKLSGVSGGTIAIEPALTPQARTELLNQLMSGAAKINTADAAEVYATEIIKVTLSGAPEAELNRALESVKGKGLEALTRDSLNLI